MDLVWHYLVVTNSAFISWFGSLELDVKQNYSYAGAGIAFAGYAYTFYRIWWGNAKPNPMSWIGFGFLTGVGAGVQLWLDLKHGHNLHHAILASLTMDLTAVCCFIQGGARILRKQIWKEGGGWDLRDFSPTTWDGFWSWLTLALGVACFVAFIDANAIGLTPFEAAAYATLSDMLLYGPIIITSWSFPRSEVATGYVMQSMKNAPAIVALPHYTPAAWIYNAMLFVVNLMMIGYFSLRRAKVSTAKEDRLEAIHKLILRTPRMAVT